MLCHELNTPSILGILISIARSILGNHRASIHTRCLSFRELSDMADSSTCTDCRWPGTALEQSPNNLIKSSSAELLP